MISLPGASVVASVNALLISSLLVLSVAAGYC